jgi:hypothetical protein
MLVLIYNVERVNYFRYKIRFLKKDKKNCYGYPSFKEKVNENFNQFLFYNIKTLS